MNRYELVFIVDAHAPQEEREEIAKQVLDSVAKVEGKVINSNVWLERQKMSFPIKKKIEGTYYMVNMEAQPSSITKLRQTLKLNEKLLRSLIIQVEQKAAR